MSGCDDLNRALYDALVEEPYTIDPIFRSHMRWVMSPAWMAVIKKMADPAGEVYWREGSRYLLGIQFDVMDGGGPPHLVTVP